MPLVPSPQRLIKAGSMPVGIAVATVCLAVVGASAAGGSPKRPPVVRASVDRTGDAADRAPARSAAARVDLGPGGRDIRLAGDLDAGVAARLCAMLAAHPDVARIHLTSDGGLVDEAVALGALVAERGLSTYVPDACASACTLVFVRGRQRYLAAGARLGFHAPYETGPAGRAFPVDAAPERAAYIAAGVAPAFVAQALAVPSDDIWIPDAPRLRAAGIVTEVVGTDRFPDSTLDADSSPRAARAELLRSLPILAALDGATVDALAAWYRDGYLSGRSEAEAVAGLRRLASADLRSRFRGADDATVLTLGRAILAAMRAEEGSDACEAIAAGDLVAVDRVLRAHPEGADPGSSRHCASRHMSGAATRSGVTGCGSGAARPTAAGLDRLVVRTVRPTQREDVSTPAHDEAVVRTAGPTPKRCAAVIDAARQALVRPSQDAAATVRSLFLHDVPPTIAGLVAR